MIVCPRCSKENQDHYKFCLGCGSELPREPVSSARVNSPQTPPSQALSAAQSAALQATDAPPSSPDKSMEFARTHQTEAERIGRAPAAPVAPAPIGASQGMGAPAVSPPVFPTTPRGQDNSGGGSPGFSAGAAAHSGPGYGGASPSVSPGGGPNSCPACGNPVPVDFKFCGTCGHRMPAAVQHASPAPPASEASRRSIGV